MMSREQSSIVLFFEGEGGGWGKQGGRNGVRSVSACVCFGKTEWREGAWSTGEIKHKPAPCHRRPRGGGGGGERGHAPHFDHAGAYACQPVDGLILMLTCGSEVWLSKDPTRAEVCHVHQIRKPKNSHECFSQ